MRERQILDQLISRALRRMFDDCAVKRQDRIGPYFLRRRNVRAGDDHTLKVSGGGRAERSRVKGSRLELSPRQAQCRV